MVGATPWGELLAEVDQPPVWSTQISLVRGSLWVSARAWRTLRMDVLLWGKREETEAGGQIWVGLMSEIVGGLDWGSDVRVTTATGDVALWGGDGDVRRRCIIQVKDGVQLEPVINLLARFKERWEAW